ncbi:hypothetical protein I552_0611 [Mycobacterium xenopi 3993]|nr:hypothetical protein I552_0611 [Mycobacterium xenopi 3993]
MRGDECNTAGIDSFVDARVWCWFWSGWCRRCAENGWAVATE